MVTATTATRGRIQRDNTVLQDRRSPVFRPARAGLRRPRTAPYLAFLVATLSLPAHHLLPLAIAFTLVCATSTLAPAQSNARTQSQAREWYHLATEARSQGDFATAERWLRAAVEADPWAVVPRLDWATLLLRVERPDEVAAALAPLESRTDELGAENPRAASRYYRLVAALAAHRGDHRDAIVYYERAVLYAPHDVRLRLQIIGLHRARKQIEQTVPHLRALSGLRAQSFEIRFELARTLLELERWTEAERAFDSAVALGPDNAAAWDGLGRSLAGQRRCAEAERAFRSGLEFEPDSSRIHEHLGDLLFACRQFRAALAAYQRAGVLNTMADPELQSKIDATRRSITP